MYFDTCPTNKAPFPLFAFWMVLKERLEEEQCLVLSSFQLCFWAHLIKVISTHECASKYIKIAGFCNKICPSPKLRRLLCRCNDLCEMKKATVGTSNCFVKSIQKIEWHNYTLTLCSLLRGMMITLGNGKHVLARGSLIRRHKSNSLKNDVNDTKIKDTHLLGQCNIS